MSMSPSGPSVLTFALIPYVTYPFYLDAIICHKGENYCSLLLLQNEPTMLVTDFSMELQESMSNAINHASSDIF